MSEQFGWLKTSLTAATTTAGGDAAGIANPEGEQVYITRVLVNVTTEATGAASMNVGVAAAATTTSDTIIDGADVGTAAAVFDSADETDSGTNGKAGRLWGSGQFVTATPSATLAGLVGSIYIEYKRLA